MSVSPTAGYSLHHTMLRVKDPEVSRHFYEGLLGLRYIAKRDFPAGKFSLIFYGYVPHDVPIPQNEDDAWTWLFSSKQSFIELTHNWGTEKDPEFSYHTSTRSDPKVGFGHIGITVSELDAAVDRLEKEGVKILKKPSEGTMRNIAFVADPDGYAIELIQSPH